MPWLSGTALLHSAVVMEKRNALKIWTILLAILTLLAVADRHLPGPLGRAHVGARVCLRPDARRVHPRHPDAVHRRRAGAVRLRAPLLKQGGLFAPISREGSLVLNNLFLVSACATVFVGTLYPLALEAITGDKISVGPPFFNWTFGPLFVPLLVAMPFGPLMAWKRGDLLGVAQRLIGAGGGCRDRHAITFAVEGGGPILVPFAIGLAVFVIAGALTDVVERTGLLKVAGAHGVRACGGPAALGLGFGNCASRPRHYAARHRRRNSDGRRTHCRVAARAVDLDPPL